MYVKKYVKYYLKTKKWLNENINQTPSLTKLIFYDGMRKLAVLSSPIYTSVSYFNVLFSGIISYSWLFHTESQFKTIRKDWRCLNIFGSSQRNLDITSAGNPSPLVIYTRSLFLFYHTVTRFFYVSVIM